MLPHPGQGRAREGLAMDSLATFIPKAPRSPSAGTLRLLAAAVPRSMPTPQGAGGDPLFEFDDLEAAFLLFLAGFGGLPRLVVARFHGNLLLSGLR